ncbi:MAG: hypothetical protein GC159_23550 [Phycisphaera sp.]|nr:hypothetical protein [Phycisphaera sp.]
MASLLTPHARNPIGLRNKFRSGTSRRTLAPIRLSFIDELYRRRCDRTGNGERRFSILILSRYGAMNRFCRRIMSCALLAVIVGATAASPLHAASLELKKGDHIVYIGNTLAERMQNDGWFEAYVQATLPDLDLVFRNHGYSGDRINKRPRNSGFMDEHEYLSLSKADVIFAFFGYNESYDGKPDGFKADIIKWIDDTLKRDYSGHGAPRIVLVSPIAHEDLNTHNLPNGKLNNRRLAAYTDAMKQAAEEKGVPFVDLFTVTKRAYAKTAQPLTINGIHLTTEGNRVISRAMFQSLFGKEAPADSSVEKLRQAVIDKNWYWFNRYRATDGNDIWGGRSKLKFTNDQTNREVMQRELEQLDVMTANRDKRVHAVAHGGDLTVDDSNVPASVPVETNFKSPKLKQQSGVNKTGSLEYLTPSESLEKLKVADGMKANVFASEEMFPELVNPVQMSVDTKGRLWVAAWKTYPKWTPLGKQEDRLLILPDENRDGVADKCIVFAQVNNPTGFEFWNGGVIVASAPDILFLKDTDGDDVADVREVLFHGIDSADTHHTANNFVYGPDGNFYYQRGVFHVSNVETPWETNQQSGTSGEYRFNPRTFEFSFHAKNGPNSHGISFDYWGYHFATDGTSGNAFQVKPDGKGGFKMQSLLKKTVRPVPSSGILSSAQFPEHNNGNFLICNAIAFLGIKQYKLDYNTDTGDVHGTEIEDLLVSDDRNFRPTDFVIGDDGGLYVSDWCNPIIGHMQHNIRDPSRDHSHGRVFRVICEGRPLSPHVQIDGAPIPALLDLLKDPVDNIRYRARIELSERDTKAVMIALKQWVKQFDPKKKEDAHHLMEALWLHQQFNVKDPALLQDMLNSPEPNARIAAKTVEQFWSGQHSSDPTVAEEGGADELKDGPGVVVIRTVQEMMRYDKKEFTVKAGEKFKLVFKNDDFIPHNFVIAQPGAAEEVANKAIAMGAEGFVKGFMPDSDKILYHTKLLDYQNVDIIEVTAPDKPGDYDYLCTFPGHWQLMRGVMKVR